MAKKVKTLLKLSLTAGQANPGPPLGPTLAQHRVNLMEFVTAYNERTRDKMGEKIPAVVTVYEDGSFTFELRKPPAAALLLKAIKKDAGSGEPNRKKIGKVSKKDLEPLAQEKMEDLNAKTVEAAVETLAGTARSMGIDVVE